MISLLTQSGRGRATIMAFRLRRQALAYGRASKRCLAGFAASILNAIRKPRDPYGIEAGCRRIKEMRLNGFARPYKRRAR